MMDAVRRLLGLAGHLSRSPECPASPQQAPDTLEELKDLWCVPWRPLQSPTALQATARLLANLRPAIEYGVPGQFSLDQVQLVARVLHVCANAGPSYMPTPGLAPTQMDIHVSLLRVLEAAAALLVPWAAQLSTPVDDLSADCLCRAALSACSLPLPSPLPSPLPPLPVSASLLTLHAARCHLLPPQTALSHLLPLWSPPLAPSPLLSPPFARPSLTSLLTVLPPQTDMEAWRLAVSSVARMGPGLPLLEDLITAAQHNSHGEKRKTSLQALCHLMGQADMVEGAVACVGAAALLTCEGTQQHDHIEQQAWRALVEVARRVSGPQEADLNFNFNLKGAWGGDTEKGDREMGDRGKGAWGEGGGRERERQAAKATLIVALSHIGLHASPSFMGVDGSECLSVLLRLVLEAVSDNGRLTVGFEDEGGVTDTGGPLMQQVLRASVSASSRLSSSLVPLLLHSSDVARSQSLSTLRAYCATVAEAADISPSAVSSADNMSGGSSDNAAGVLRGNLAENDRPLAVQFVLQLWEGVLSSGVVLSPVEATWVLESLAHLATVTIDTPLESLLWRGLDGLCRVVESRPEAEATARDHALTHWATLLHSPASSSPALDRRGSLWQRACVSLCLETRRPQPYPSVSQVISRLLTCIETLPPSSLSRQSAHRRLRSIVANPRVLAYRAGPQVHWDEARRRVLVSYVQAALRSFPLRTSEQDLAYCIGAAIGGLPHDAEGQGVLLACLSLIRTRATELWAQDPGGQMEATAAVTKLLYQALVMCPPRTLKAGLQCTSEFVAGLENEASRRGALALLRGILGSDHEGMRQAELVKWYLVLVDRLVKK